MKKVIASFAVVIYFAFACGVMVNYHYCMNSFDSIRLYKAATDWCTKCGMHTKKHGCCHDEVRIVKIQDDHQTSSANYSIEKIQPVITRASELLSTAFLDKKEALIKVDHSPPLLTQREIYIQNCVFRI